MVNGKKKSPCKLVLQTDQNVVKSEEEVQTQYEHVYNPNAEVLHVFIQSLDANASSVSHFLSHTSFPIIVY
jgi:hypothetical protein